MSFKRHTILRVWNKQLISYACYEIDNGVFIGDKGSIEFTKVNIFKVLKRVKYIKFTASKV